MNQEKIGNFIKQLREDKDWTQEQLAQKINIVREAVSKWERGKSIPEIETIEKLSEVFNISIEEILAGEKNPQTNITLKLFKDNQKKQKIIKLFILIIIIIFLLFGIYYFINQYKSTTIYRIGTNSENFTINGLAIKTRDKVYFNIDNITSLKNQNITKIELYYKENNHLISSTTEKYIQLNDYSDNGEYFNWENYQNIFSNIYLKIYYDDKYEDIELLFYRDYINDNLIFRKSKSGFQETPLPSNKSLSSFEENILNTFAKVDEDTYYKKIIEENKTLDLFYIQSSQLLNLSITIDDEIQEEYIFYTSTNSIKYKNYQKNQEYSFNYNNNFQCLSETCPSEKIMQEKVNYFQENLQKIFE